MNLLERHSLRIVHIEDNDDFSTIAKIFLRHKGFTHPVTHFDCGPEAIEYLLRVEPKCAPHVILLDLHMPGMNGFDVLHWLRNEYCDMNVPVFMMSASDDPEDIREAKSAGVTSYLLKNDLYSKLSKHFDHFIELHNYSIREVLTKLPGVMAELALMSKFTENAVVLTDQDGSVIWVNESFVKICGHTLVEIRGRKLVNVLQGPASNPAKVQLLQDTFQSAKRCECKIINYRKNGDPYPAHISMGPIFTDGALEGFLAVKKELMTSPRTQAGMRDIVQELAEVI